MKSVILSLDQGTTSSRAILFDHDGKIVSLSQHEFPQYFPKPGWVEHDPEEIWQTQILSAREAIAKEPVKVEAIGITNQRETTILWNKHTGKAVYPAIVWQCRRTADMIEELLSLKTPVVWIVNRDNPGVNRTMMRKYLCFTPEFSQAEVPREIIVRAEYNCLELNELIKLEGIEKLADYLKVF